MTAIDPKTYAQLASRVYDRKDIRNKMTLPQDFTELGWQDDDPLTVFGKYRFRLPYACFPKGKRP